MIFLVIAGIAIFFLVFYVLSQWYEITKLNAAYEEITEFTQKFTIEESGERFSVYNTLEEVMGEMYKKDDDMPESIKKFFSKIFDGFLLSSKQSVKMVGIRLLQKEFSFRLNKMQNSEWTVADFFGSLLDLSLFLGNEYPSFSDWDAEELSDSWVRNRDVLYKKMKQYANDKSPHGSFEEILQILLKLKERSVGLRCAKSVEDAIQIFQNAWKKNFARFIAEESAKALQSTDPQEKYLQIYQSLTRIYPAFAQPMVEDARIQLVEDAHTSFESTYMKDVTSLDSTALIEYMKNLQDFKTRETLVETEKIQQAYNYAKAEYHKKLYEETCVKLVTFKILEETLSVCTTSPYKEKLEERIRLFKIYTETVQEVPTEAELRDLTKDSSLVVVYSQPENLEKSETADHPAVASA